MGSVLGLGMQFQRGGGLSRWHISDLTSTPSVFLQRGRGSAASPPTWGRGGPCSAPAVPGRLRVMGSSVQHSAWMLASCWRDDDNKTAALLSGHLTRFSEWRLKELALILPCASF